MYTNSSEARHDGYADAADRELREHRGLIASVIDRINPSEQLSTSSLEWCPAGWSILNAEAGDLYELASEIEALVSEGRGLIGPDAVSAAWVLVVDGYDWETACLLTAQSVAGEALTWERIGARIALEAEISLLVCDVEFYRTARVSA